jgi:SAM-dependent methyltransferase
VETPLGPDDPKTIVRQGYDRISHSYRDDVGAANLGYPLWLETYLLPCLTAGARVLDLGCGNGVPGTLMLAERFEVTGVDISDVQIARARQLVPKGKFVCADMTTVAFPPASFEAVVSFFALIHIPLEEQPEILSRISRCLMPGGLFLATVGHRAWTGIADFYGATMYWSQADAATYVVWLSQVGIDVVEREFIAEDPQNGHELLLGVRRPSP